MEPELEEAVAWCLETLGSRQAAYAEAEAYYEGHQRSSIDLDRVRSSLGRLLSDFAVNLCAPVVDCTADRIVVRGFDDTGTDADVPGEAESSPAEALWELGLMDAQQAAVHQEALTLGDSYVVVWPSREGVPTVYPSSGKLTLIRYSEDTPGRGELAVKVWVEDRTGGYQRLTVYLPDQVLRFYKDAGEDAEVPFKTEGMEPYGEDESGPVIPNPWGVVPVFGLHNRAGIGKLGTSALRDVIPLQDGLNKSVVDMVVGMEAGSFPQRWATGVEVPLNNDGSPQDWKPTDAIWTTPTPDASFGTFPAADLGQIVGVQQGWAQMVSAVSGVPMHLLVGVEAGNDWPSGRALEVAESRLVKLAEARQVTWAPVWAAAMALATSMARQAPHGALETLWVPAFVADEQTQAETALVKKQLGVSDSQLQRELGYTEEQIARNEEEAAMERTASAGALARGLDGA